MDLLGLADMSGGIAPFPFLLAAACGSKLQGGDSLGSPLRDAARAGLLLACNTRFWLCGLSVTTALALGIHGGAGVASPSAGEARSSPPPSLSISLEEAGCRCGLVDIQNEMLERETSLT
ncbi:hypothetical protein BDA96_01G124800 [Sorghum bicolor]|uniref:Uncharacterized protein n=1 Tax=Sorghum bicolor TaxID=4558 RepID=A0A921RWR2_SORBI|nr:hypothetical protein BDA96_01G124800 [Sorghum bicolor]